MIDLTEQPENPPQHCGRGMWAVKDNDNAPIWWCAECHVKTPRTARLAELPACDGEHTS